MSANVWDIKYSPSKKLQIWNYIFDYHSRSQKTLQALQVFAKKLFLVPLDYTSRGY